MRDAIKQCELNITSFNRNYLYKLTYSVLLYDIMQFFYEVCVNTSHIYWTVLASEVRRRSCRGCDECRCPWATPPSRSSARPGRGNPGALRCLAVRGGAPRPSKDSRRLDRANFGGFVLGCIEACDSESRLIFQHFLRSTRFSHFRTFGISNGKPLKTQNSKFSQYLISPHFSFNSI